MKKVIAILMSLVLTISLTGCFSSRRYGYSNPEYMFEEVAEGLEDIVEDALDGLEDLFDF